MFILAVLHEEAKEVRGGKLIKRQLAFALDNLNVILAEQLSNRGFVGISWAGRFNHLREAIASKGIPLQVAAERLWDAICPILSPGSEKPLPLTLDALDHIFNVPERKSDASGILTLYDKLYRASQRVGKFDRFLTKELIDVSN